MRRASSDERGFTLVEVLASILVFAIVTLGVVPLLLSSVRGSTLARSFTVGKNVTLQAMERARGLPYNRQVSDGGVPQKVDVLDLYFPRGFGAGFDATADTFTVTCTSASTAIGSPACPAGSIPPGYTVTFTATFVQECDASNTASCVAVTAGDPERYEKVDVPSTYYWQGSSTTGPEATCTNCSDKPPTQLLQLRIQTSWQAIGRNRSYNLTSLLGDRKFGGPKVDGLATIDHLVQLRSSFNDGTQTSSITATGGLTETRIAARLVTTAAHSGRAGRLILSGDAIPVSSAHDKSGAAVVAQAPPDVGGGTPLSDNAGATDITHPQLLIDAGGIDSSSVDGVEAGVAIDLPQARGELSIDGSSPLGLLWVNTQMPAADANPLSLDTDAGKVAWLAQGTDGLDADAEAFTNPVAVDRKVYATAAGSFSSLRLFPSELVLSDPDGGAREGAVVAFENFDAEVECEATAAAAAINPNPVATYSVDLSYWRETDPNDGVTKGSYQTIANLGNAAGRAAFLQLMADPPMVHEDTTSLEGSLNRPEGSPGDVYLFPVSHSHEVLRDEDNDGVEELVTITHNHPGYLTNWTALATPTTSEDASGRLVSARIDQAISFSSAQLNPAVADSVISGTVGTLSCSVSDLR